MLHNFGLTIDYYAMVNFAGAGPRRSTRWAASTWSRRARCTTSSRATRTTWGGAIVRSALRRHVHRRSVAARDARAGSRPSTSPSPGMYSLTACKRWLTCARATACRAATCDRGRREQRVVRALLAKAKQLDSHPQAARSCIAQFQRDTSQTDMPLDQILYFASIADRFNDAIIRSRFLDPGGANGATLPTRRAMPRAPAPGGHVSRSPEDAQRGAEPTAQRRHPDRGVERHGRPRLRPAAADRLSELGFRIVDVKAADQLVRPHHDLRLHHHAQGQRHAVVDAHLRHREKMSLPSRRPTARVTASSSGRISTPATTHLRLKRRAMRKSPPPIPRKLLRPPRRL